MKSNGEKAAWQAGRLAAALAGFALLGGALGACLDRNGQQVEHQPAANAAPAVTTQAQPKGALEPPRGASGATQVLRRLQANSADRGSQAADAAAVASGAPPAAVSGALAAQALDQPNESLRRQAVARVALQRSNDATDLLLATASDPAPAVRRQSVEALWISAKDMRERMPEIEAALQEALGDNSPAVVELAQRALADIEKQKQRDTTPPAPDLTTPPPQLPGMPPPSQIPSGQ